MKLTDKIKNKIDNFFENITPEELYRISVEKYGFVENTDIEIENQTFDTIKKSLYPEICDVIDVESVNTSLPLAA